MKELTLEGLLKAVKNSPQDAFLVDLSGQALADVRCKQKTPLEYTDTKWIEDNQRMGYPVPIDACMLLNASNNSLMDETFDQRFLRFFPNAWWLNIANNPHISKAGESFPRGLGKLDIRGTKFSKNSILSLSNTHVIHLIEDIKDGSFSSDHNKREYLVANMPFVWCINGEFVSSSEQLKCRSMRDISNPFLSPLTFNVRTMSDREKALILLNQNIPANPLLCDSVRLDIILEDYLNEAEIFNDFGLKRLKLNQMHASVPKMPFVSINRIFDLPRRLRIDLITVIAINILFDMPHKLLLSALEKMFSITLPDGKSQLQFFTTAELRDIVDLPSLIKTAIVNLVRRLLMREILEIDTIGGKLSRPILDPKNTELTRHLDLNSNCGIDFKSGEDGEYKPLMSVNRFENRHELEGGRRNPSLATKAIGYDFCHLRLTRNYLERPQYVSRSDMYVEYSEGKFSEFEMEIVKNLPPVVTKSLYSFIYPDHVLAPGEREKKSEKYAISFLCRHVILILKKSKLCPTLVRAQTTISSQKYYNELLPLLQCGTMTYEDLGIQFSGVSSLFNNSINTNNFTRSLINNYKNNSNDNNNNSNNNNNDTNTSISMNNAQQTTEQLEGDTLANFKRDGRVCIRTCNEIINTNSKTSGNNINNIINSNNKDKVLFGGQALGFGYGLPKGVPSDLFWNSTQVQAQYMRDAYGDTNGAAHAVNNMQVAESLEAVTEEASRLDDTLEDSNSPPKWIKEEEKEENAASSGNLPAITDSSLTAAAAAKAQIQLDLSSDVMTTQNNIYKTSIVIQKSTIDQLGNFNLSQELAADQGRSNPPASQAPYDYFSRKTVTVPGLATTVLKTVQVYTEDVNSKPSFAVGPTSEFADHHGEHSTSKVKGGNNINSSSSKDGGGTWSDLMAPLVFAHPGMPPYIADCDIKTYSRDINLSKIKVDLDDVDAQRRFTLTSQKSEEEDTFLDMQARVTKLKKIKYKLTTFGFDSLSHYQFFLNLSFRAKQLKHPLAHVLYRNKDKQQQQQQQQQLQQRRQRQGDAYNQPENAVQTNIDTDFELNHTGLGSISEELLLQTLTGDEKSELEMRAKIDMMLSSSSIEGEDYHLHHASQEEKNNNENRIKTGSTTSDGSVSFNNNVEYTRTGVGYNPNPNPSATTYSDSNHPIGKLHAIQSLSNVTEITFEARQRLMLEMGTLKNYRNLNNFNDKVFLRTSNSAPTRGDDRQSSSFSVSKSANNWISSIKSNIGKSTDGKLVKDTTFLTNENQYFETADNAETKAEFFESRMSTYSNPDPTTLMSSTQFLGKYHNYGNIKKFSEASFIPAVTSISNKVISPLWTEVPSKVMYVLSKDTNIDVISNSGVGLKDNDNDLDNVSISESIMNDFKSPIMRFSNYNLDNFPIYSFDTKTTAKRFNSDADYASSVAAAVPSYMLAQGERFMSKSEHGIADGVIVESGMDAQTNSNIAASFSDNLLANTSPFDNNSGYNDSNVSDMVANLKLEKSEYSASYGSFMDVPPGDNIEGKIPKGVIYNAVYNGRSNRELVDRVHHSKVVNLPLLVKSESDSNFVLASAAAIKSKNNNNSAAYIRAVGIKDGGAPVTKSRVNTVTLSQRLLNPPPRRGIMVRMDDGNCNLLLNEVKSSRDFTSSSPTGDKERGALMSSAETQALMNSKFPYISTKKANLNSIAAVNPYANKPSSYKYLSQIIDQKNSRQELDLRLNRNLQNQKDCEIIEFNDSNTLPGSYESKFQSPPQQASILHLDAGVGTSTNSTGPRTRTGSRSPSRRSREGGGRGSSSEGASIAKSAQAILDAAVARATKQHVEGETQLTLSSNDGDGGDDVVAAPIAPTSLTEKSRDQIGKIDMSSDQAVDFDDDIIN